MAVSIIKRLQASQFKLITKKSMPDVEDHFTPSLVDQLRFDQEKSDEAGKIEGAGRVARIYICWSVVQHVSGAGATFLNLQAFSVPPTSQASPLVSFPIDILRLLIKEFAMLSFQTFVFILAVADSAMAAALGEKHHAAIRDSMGRHSRRSSRNPNRQQSVGARALTTDGCHTIPIKVQGISASSTDAWIVSGNKAKTASNNLTLFLFLTEFGSQYLPLHTKWVCRTVTPPHKLALICEPCPSDSILTPDSASDLEAAVLNAKKYPSAEAFYGKEALVLEASTNIAQLRLVPCEDTCPFAFMLTVKPFTARQIRSLLRLCRRFSAVLPQALHDFVPVFRKNLPRLYVMKDSKREPH